MNLNDAEIWVTTQSRIDAGSPDGYPFVLSEYGEAAEFDTARSDYFHTETNPDYKYPAWENIPGALINRDWFSPNFFEIRDAMERLDDTDQDFFLDWCRCQGHDITTDDTHQLVSHFEDMHGTSRECEEPAEPPDDLPTYASSTYRLADLGISSVEIFDDNYD